MAGIVESFRQGYEGRDSGRYEIAGSVIKCGHCGGEHFDVGNSLLNTRGLTFLNLDFADQGAHLLICTNCTHVEWFIDEPVGL